MVTEETRRALQTARDSLESQGKLANYARVDESITRFQARFGPEHLARADGEALLELMHGRGTHSLAYWLEFKNDDEFPDIFGSIAGGSALKFGIFKRAESGEWTTGTPTNQRVLTTSEAVSIVREQRDELMAGAKVLSSMPANPLAEDYERLEAEMRKAAPAIQAWGWAHKYFFLCAPKHLDDYHSNNWQRSMQRKLLLTPTPDEQRYLAAWPFVSLARELGWSVPLLTTVLNHKLGPPYKYWRVGTTAGTTSDSQWSWMKARGVAAVGWESLGDLSWVEKSSEAKDKLRDLMKQHHPNDPRAIGKQTNQLFNFICNVSPGDVVIAAEGQVVRAIGRVLGGYAHDANLPFPHTRAVDWVSNEEWEMPDPTEGLRTTVSPLTDDANIVAIERKLRARVAEPPGPGPIDPPPWVGPTNAVHRKIHEALNRKGAVILYGPPGTGKTWTASQACRDFAAQETFRKAFDALTEAERLAIAGGDGKPGLVRICTFHPGYGYEDFVEGYRPAGEGKGFVLRKGVFRQLCEEALAHPSQRFYFIIDEFNRADVTRVLGELFTLLELDKRDDEVVLPYSGERFRVPRNVFIVGTMNTADRSIAVLDTALRRRFAFIELLPDYAPLARLKDANVDLARLARTLNERIVAEVRRDGRNLQIGHAFFLHGGKPISDWKRLAKVLDEDVLPLVQEYCYDNWEAFGRIVGTSFVDVAARVFRRDAFETEEELHKALRAISEQIVVDLAPVTEDVTEETDA